MPESTPSSNSHTPKQEKSTEFNSPLLKVVVVALVVVGLVGAYVMSHPNAKSTSQLSSLYINSSAKKLVKGRTYPVEIWVDTKGQPVNAVQADLLFPADKLSAVSVDGTKSALTISAQSTIANGSVKIARGNFQPITGNKLVAVVNVKALTNTGKVTLSFARTSAVARATDNRNILTGTTGINLSLSLMNSFKGVQLIGGRLIK